MLDAKHIEPVKPPFGAGVLFSENKDGTMRVCTNDGKLNSITKKDSHPLPWNDEILDDMVGATIFSKLDLAQGYQKFLIRPDHVPKTAFQTRKAVNPNIDYQRRCRSTLRRRQGISNTEMFTLIRLNLNVLPLDRIPPIIHLFLFRGQTKRPPPPTSKPSPRSPPS